MAGGPTDPGDKPQRGRPKKLTVEIALGIAAAILEGNFRYVAGQAFGVSAERFRRWMQQGRRFPDGLYGQFRWVVLEAEAEAERRAVKSILAAGTADDPRHLEWWLERKFPQRWGRFRGELVLLRKRVAELEKMLADDPPDREAEVAP